MLSQQSHLQQPPVWNINHSHHQYLTAFSKHRGRRLVSIPSEPHPCWPQMQGPLLHEGHEWLHMEEGRGRGRSRGLPVWWLCATTCLFYSQRRLFCWSYNWEWLLEIKTRKKKSRKKPGQNLTALFTCRIIVGLTCRGFWCIAQVK